MKPNIKRPEDGDLKFIPTVFLQYEAERAFNSVRLSDLIGDPKRVPILNQIPKEKENV